MSLHQEDASGNRPSRKKTRRVTIGEAIRTRRVFLGQMIDSTMYVVLAKHEDIMLEQAPFLAGPDWRRVESPLPGILYYLPGGAEEIQAADPWREAVFGRGFSCN